ncbi:MAG: hypothetical protein ACLFPA_03150 [Dichotomicrobium sp.]
MLREIARVGRVEDEHGAGIACQIDVGEATGLIRQISALEGNAARRRGLKIG